MDSFGTYLFRGMYRNRPLLDLAHRIETCQNCKATCRPGCEPAHSNEPEHGKGTGLKAHDCFFAALCHACHAWYDNQGGNGRDPTGLYEPTAEGKRQMFTKAMQCTWLMIMQHSWLKVAR